MDDPYRVPLPRLRRVDASIIVRSPVRVQIRAAAKEMPDALVSSLRYPVPPCPVAFSLHRKQSASCRYTYNAANTYRCSYLDTYDAANTYRCSYLDSRDDHLPPPFWQRIFVPVCSAT